MDYKLIRKDAIVHEAKANAMSNELNDILISINNEQIYYADVDDPIFIYASVLNALSGDTMYVMSDAAVAYFEMSDNYVANLGKAIVHSVPKITINTVDTAVILNPFNLKTMIVKQADFISQYELSVMRIPNQLYGSYGFVQMCPTIEDPGLPDPINVTIQESMRIFLISTKNLSELTIVGAEFTLMESKEFEFNGTNTYSIYYADVITDDIIDLDLNDTIYSFDNRYIAGSFISNTFDTHLELYSAPKNNVMVAKSSRNQYASGEFFYDDIISYGKVTTERDIDGRPIYEFLGYIPWSNTNTKMYAMLGENSSGNDGKIQRVNSIEMYNDMNVYQANVVTMDRYSDSLRMWPKFATSFSVSAYHILIKYTLISDSSSSAIAPMQHLAVQKFKDTIDNTSIGSIAWFATNDAKDGYLLCDGSLQFRDDFVELFEYMGTKFGVGNNASTFNLPDLIDHTSELTPFIRYRGAVHNEDIILGHMTEDVELTGNNIGIEGDSIELKIENFNPSYTYTINADVVTSLNFDIISVTLPNVGQETIIKINIHAQNYESNLEKSNITSFDITIINYNGVMDETVIYNNFNNGNTSQLMNADVVHDDIIFEGRTRLTVDVANNKIKSPYMLYTQDVIRLNTDTDIDNFTNYTIDSFDEGDDSIIDYNLTLIPDIFSDDSTIAGFTLNGHLRSLNRLNENILSVQSNEYLDSIYHLGLSVNNLNKLYISNAIGNDDIKAISFISSLTGNGIIYSNTFELLLVNAKLTLEYNNISYVIDAASTLNDGTDKSFTIFSEFDGAETNINIIDSLDPFENSGLIAKYTLNDDVVELISTIPATVVGNETYASSKFTTGLLLDGTTYLDLGTTFNLIGAAPRTFRFNIKWDGSSVDESVIFYMGDDIDDDSIMLIKKTDNLLTFGTFNNLIDIAYTSTTADSTAYITYDGVDLNLYIDKVLLHTMPVDLVTSDTTILFGDDLNSTLAKYTGIVDQIEIYNYCINALQMDQLFAERIITHVSTTVKIYVDNVEMYNNRFQDIYIPFTQNIIMFTSINAVIADIKLLNRIPTIPEIAILADMHRSTTLDSTGYIINETTPPLPNNVLTAYLVTKRAIFNPIVNANSDLYLGITAGEQISTYNNACLKQINDGVINKILVSKNEITPTGHLSLFKPFTDYNNTHEYINIPYRVIDYNAAENDDISPISAEMYRTVGGHVNQLDVEPNTISFELFGKSISISWMKYAYHNNYVVTSSNRTIHRSKDLFEGELHNDKLNRTMAMPTEDTRWYYGGWRYNYHGAALYTEAKKRTQAYERRESLRFAYSDEHNNVIKIGVSNQPRYYSLYVPDNLPDKILMNTESVASLPDKYVITLHSQVRSAIGGHMKFNTATDNGDGTFTYNTILQISTSGVYINGVNEASFPDPDIMHKVVIIQDDVNETTDILIDGVHVARVIESILDYSFIDELILYGVYFLEFSIADINGTPIVHYVCDETTLHVENVFTDRSGNGLDGVTKDGTTYDPDTRNHTNQEVIDIFTLDNITFEILDTMRLPTTVTRQKDTDSRFTARADVSINNTFTTDSDNYFISTTFRTGYNINYYNTMEVLSEVDRGYYGYETIKNYPAVYFSDTFMYNDTLQYIEAKENSTFDHVISGSTDNWYVYREFRQYCYFVHRLGTVDLLSKTHSLIHDQSYNRTFVVWRYRQGRNSYTDYYNLYYNHDINYHNYLGYHLVGDDLKIMYQDTDTARVRRYNLADSVYDGSNTMLLTANSQFNMISADDYILISRYSSGSLMITKHNYSMVQLDNATLNDAYIGYNYAIDRTLYGDLTHSPNNDFIVLTYRDRYEIKVVKVYMAAFNENLIEIDVSSQSLDNFDFVINNFNPVTSIALGTNIISIAHEFTNLLSDLALDSTNIQLQLSYPPMIIDPDYKSDTITLIAKDTANSTMNQFTANLVIDDGNSTNLGAPNINDSYIIEANFDPDTNELRLVNSMVTVDDLVLDLGSAADIVDATVTNNILKLTQRNSETIDVDLGTNNTFINAGVYADGILTLTNTVGEDLEIELEIELKDIYSEAETQTSKFMTQYNKYIYRKGLVIHALPNNSTIMSIHGIDFHRITNVEMMFTDGTYYNNTLNIDVKIDDTYIVITSAQDLSAFSGTIYVEYIKPITP